MNRSEAKELLPIIQAFAEGKEIEFRSKGFDEEWRDLKQIPGLSYDSFEYRIKPKPRNRSFKNPEECWQEMLKHQPFGWIKSKTDSHYSMVTVVDAAEDMKSIAIGGNHVWSFDETMSDYTFADGAPFGVKED